MHDPISVELLVFRRWEARLGLGQASVETHHSVTQSNPRSNSAGEAKESEPSAAKQIIGKSGS